MENKPLTEKDIKDFWNEKIDDEYVEWNPLWIELKKVQSAKCLLKHKLMQDRDISLRAGIEILRIVDMVDACFDIPDGDSFSAENLGENSGEHKVPYDEHDLCVCGYNRMSHDLGLVSHGFKKRGDNKE